MELSRYQELFSNLPVAIWEEDFSDVKKQIDRLRTQGVENFAEHCKTHPEFVENCAGLVKILNVNQKTLDIYKAASKEALLTNLDQIFTRESLGTFTEELIALAQGQQHFYGRGPNRTLAGDTIYIEVRVVLPDAYLETWDKLLVATVDITQQYLTEQALRRNEERFRGFYRNAPLAYQSLDVDGFFLDVNSSFEDMLGYRREELLGKHITSILAPESAEALNNRFSQFIETGTVSGAEFTMLKKDGGRVEVLVNGRIGYDINGQFQQTHCMLHNITEQKQAEKELRKREKSYRQLYDQFRILFDGIPDVLLLLTPELRISWANQTASLTCGIPVENMIGKSCTELFNEYSTPCDEALTRSCLETGKTGTSLVNTPDGRSWGIRIFPIKDDEAEVTQIMELAHDITDKIKLQAETMRTGQLAALGELAAGVAHEINNPINGIINYAQILANRSQNTGEQNDIAERIVKEGDRIATIVGNLLSFSRDRVEEKRPLVLLNILNEALSLCSARLKKDGILLELNIPTDLPCLVGKHQKLEQVFINLISNAQYALNQRFPDYSEEKKLLISALGTSGGRQVKIIFHDHGTGIPANIRDRIMNPFFSTKPQGSGTGLGLSISHGIIQDHNGVLEFESSEGDFTRVILTMPAARNEAYE